MGILKFLRRWLLPCCAAQEEPEPEHQETAEDLPLVCPEPRNWGVIYLQKYLVRNFRMVRYRGVPVPVWTRSMRYTRIVCYGRWGHSVEFAEELYRVVNTYLIGGGERSPQDPDADEVDRFPSLAY